MTWIYADGKRLEARTIGELRPGSGTPALVFLHEGLGCVTRWREFPDRLVERTGLPALLYSRAGYGASDPVELPRPLDYMQREGERSVPEVLSAIERPILFGHSDGASIALVYAATAGRDKVRALILEAPHVFAEELSITSIEAARERYEHGDLRERMAKYHQHVDVAFWGWNRAWLDPEFRRWSLLGYLSAIRCPILLLQGKQDPYGTIAQLEAIRAGVSASVDVVLLEDCGHSPHRDQPEVALEESAAFLTRALRAAF